MNKERLIQYIIIIILSLLLMNQCNKDKEIIEVPIEIEVPVPSVESNSDTIYVPYPKYINNPLDKKLLKENDSLLQKYQEADSIAKELQYKEAISIKEYKQEFKDTFQTVNVYTKTRGELLEQSISYKTNEYTISIDTIVKTSVKGKLRLLGAIEMGVPLLTDNNFSKVVVKPGIIFQNSKNNGLSVSIDTEGTGWLGVIFKF